jgi:NAD(P)-dependent dehydrogenase (short-subunit alcohol dehydrogenase family)
VCPAEFFPLDTFKDVFEVNVFGVLACSQAFLPLLRKSGDGRIINMSSVVRSSLFSGLGVYSVPKKTNVYQKKKNKSFILSFSWL